MKHLASEFPAENAARVFTYSCLLHQSKRDRVEQEGKKDRRFLLRTAGMCQPVCFSSATMASG